MKTSVAFLLTALTFAVSLNPARANEPYGSGPSGSQGGRRDRREESEPEQSLDEPRIFHVYEETLGRQPTAVEVRRCRQRAESEGWRARDLEDDLRGTREFRELTPESVIKRAYRDLLNREPDPQTMRTYRRHMIEERWTPGQVRAAIRESDEYQLRSVDLIIDRAYDDLLERKPDNEGRERYRKMLRNGSLTEQSLRDRLKQSVEYRVTLPDAKTARAYRAVLGHDPDAHGTENYRKKIVDHGWTEEQIKEELRHSQEYRDRANKKPH